MNFPDFYARIPGIILYDPLAELLGAVRDGQLNYHFEDAVKLTGHACPTVAGAWLTGVGALRALYGSAIPERGNFCVAFGAAPDSGVTGVIASVLTLLTGAAGSGGFAGLGGRHGRRQLLEFGVAGVEQVRITRRDTGQQADCRLDLSAVPGDPLVGELLAAILAGRASAEQKADFGQRWQDRVRRILLESGQHPGLLQIRLSPASESGEAG